MLFQVVYRFAFVLFLTKTTTEGADHGVFFQIKENSFLGFSEESLVWSGKTDSLLSCSALCGRETSCRRANFLENQRLCHLLRGEVQTSSAAGHLYQRDGSTYLKKVFAIADMLQFSDDNSKHDNFSTTTAIMITFTIISREKHCAKCNFCLRKTMNKTGLWHFIYIAL